MAFADIAPIIQAAGISQGAVENYFENLAPKPIPVDDPEITADKISIVAGSWAIGFINVNGVRDLARSAGLTLGQVSTIVAEINACKSAWDALQEVPE